MDKKITRAEGDYLKAIFHIAEEQDGRVSTNALAKQLQTSAASVTGMVKKLEAKSFISYQPYKGVALLALGRQLAVRLVRSHRLWELFLVDKLKFSWDQVHDIAEVLEHLDHPELIERLNSYLDYPKFDPHGDPIPDKNGNLVYHKEISIKQLELGKSAVVVAVTEHEKNFLQHLDSLKIQLGTQVKVKERFDYDGSAKLLVGTSKEIILSEKVAGKILVRT